MSVSTPDGGQVEIQLRDLCGVRCGDKGDISDISLFAYDQSGYEAIRREVTADKVKSHFGTLVNGLVDRFEVPNLLALKFVMYEALGGGAPSSLRSDNLGKTNGASLLRMFIRVEPEVAASAPRRRAPVESMRRGEWV